MMQIKKPKQLKKKVFITWIVTNFLIFLIPIIIGEYVYYNSVAILKHEVENVHQASVQQIKLLVDGKFEELKKIGNSLTIDATVNTLKYSQNKYTPINIYNMTKIQDDLKKYAVSNSFIDYLGIYFNSSVCLLSDHDISTGTELKTAVKKNFTAQIEDWRKQVHSVNQGNIRIFKGSSAADTKIVMFQSLSMNIYSNSPEVTLVVVLDKDKLYSLLNNNITSMHSNLTIYNKQNEYFNLNGNENLSKVIHYRTLVSARSIYNLKYGSQDNTVIHIGSDATSLQYVLTMPSLLFLEKVQNIKTVMHLYIAVCLILGIIIVYFITKRNYDPLMRIIRFSENNGLTSKENGLNEYNIIENAIQSLISDKASAEDKIKQQDLQLRRNFLMRILKGRVRNKLYVEDLLYMHQLHFDSDSFVVMAFDIEDYGTKIMKDSHEIGDETDDLLDSMLQNITEELSGTSCSVYFTEIDHMKVCLFNQRTVEDGFQLEEFSVDTAHRVLNYMKEYFDVGLSVAVSSLKTDFNQISSAYDEILEIIEHKRLMEKTNEVIHYDAVERSSEGDFNNISMMKSEIQFMNYLLDNNFNNANHILDYIMESYLPSNTTNFQIVKCRMFGLINIMLKALGEFKTKADIDYFNQLDPMNRMMNSKSVNELKKQIKEIFNSMIEYYNNTKPNEAQYKMDEIVDYINHHYFDPNLSASTIASQFEMNSSYLCRVFKKTTETSILDYIHKCRIENAKVMLGTGLSVAEVSEKVGYISSMSMIRTFKKYVGITPGKYKEECCGNE